MKIKYVVSLLVLLFSLGAVSGKSDERSIASTGMPSPSVTAEATSPAPAPFPDVCIPGVPSGDDCCLWQIQRRADGKREAKFGNVYKCDMGPHRRGDMLITMSLKFPGTVCDQQDIPANNSKLEAKGTVIRRDDQYAYFSGEFTITDPGGKVSFKGHIETTDRLGSHQMFFNCEKCNPISHFEGWLVGRGEGVFSHHTLRALLVARGTVPSPSVPSTPMTGSLTGTLIKCP